MPCNNVSMLAEPPDPPVNVVMEQVGATWVVMTWTPPVREGGAPISGYIVSGSPQATTYDSTINNANSMPLNNSACIEFNCSSARMVVNASGHANVTGLVPAVKYTMVVSALAHGFSLQSQPSSPEVVFMTLTHGKSVLICS